MKKRFTPEDTERLTLFSRLTANAAGKYAWVETRGGSSHIMTDLVSGEGRSDDKADVLSSDRHLLLTQQKPDSIAESSSDAFAGPAAPEGRLPQYRGEMLTWLSSDSGQPQIRQGEKTLTSLRHGVQWFQWSSDGESAVFTARLWEDEVENGSWNTELTGEELEKWERELAHRPKVITEIVNKHDEVHGVFDGSRSRLGLLTAEGTRILPVSLYAAFPCISPDGKRIAFFGYPHQGVRAMQPELFVYDVAGGELRCLTDGQELYAGTCACWAGDQIIYAAYVMYGPEAYDLRLYSVSAEGGKARTLMPEAGMPPVSNMPVSRSAAGDESFVYQACGEWVYYRTAWQGRERLLRVRTDGSGIYEEVLSGDFAVHAFAVVPGRSDILLAVLGTPSCAEELYRIHLTDRTPVRLTFRNSFLSDYEIMIPMESRAGEVPMWVIPPADRQPGRRYPAVLEIHGGPDCTYVLDFWHEFQALSGAGCAVLYCNPRGSSGYGPDYMNGAWGEEAVTDLLSCVEEACERYDFIDAGRIGVTGGSYGGYMTIKLAGTTKRFRAACAQRALCNTATSYGTGDMGFASASRPPEEVNIFKLLTERASRSLIRFVDNIDTPMLILHGKEDYRCTFEQAEQLFVALRERRPKVPCRLVMFPHENHGITRTGSMSHQIRHLREMTDWFVRYLEDGECVDTYPSA